MNCEACTGELDMAGIKNVVSVATLGDKYQHINSEVWLLCGECSEDMIAAIETHLKKERAKLNERN